MKKLKIFLVMMIMGTLCIASSSLGFSLLDEKLTGTLMLRNDSAVRVEDGLSGGHPGLDAGDLVLCRNTLQLELTYTFNPNLSLRTNLRTWYEASLDFNNDLKELIRSDKRDRFRKSHEELRELYLDVSGNDWFARIGKQQIIWGESDGLRMADIINPLDLTWHYIFGSWEDIRVPLWAVDFNYKLGFGPFKTVELVWLPGAFEFGFQNGELAPEGANWAFPGYSQAIIDAYEASEPDDSLRNSEFGIRLHNRIKDVEFHLYYFYSRNDVGVLKKNWLNRFMAGHKEIFAYPFNSKFGLTFNYYCGKLKTVFRGESVYTIDEPFNDRDIISNPGIYEEDTLAYMLGFDRPTWIRLLNPQRTFFISMQLFQKWMFDRPHGIGNATEGFDSSYTHLTLFINTDYYRGLIQPGIFMLYNLDCGAWINPSISYKVTNTPYMNCIVGLGSHIMLGTDQRIGFFGPFRDNSELYGWIEFSW